jgi:hypothetical protein
MREEQSLELKQPMDEATGERTAYHIQAALKRRRMVTQKAPQLLRAGTEQEFSSRGSSRAKLRLGNPCSWAQRLRGLSVSVGSVFKPHLHPSDFPSEAKPTVKS